MSMPLPPRTALWAGSLLLACWLGWTLLTFAALGTPARAQAAEVSRAVHTLVQQLPAAAGQVRAIALPDPSCPCRFDPSAWQALRAAVQAAGGVAQHAPSPSLAAVLGQVVILNAANEPLYSGPLHPPAALCGAAPNALALWLPALLSGDAPPAFLSPDCTC